MIGNRRAHGAKGNRALEELVAKNNEGNVAWLGRAGATGGLLLLGGASLAHFRLRVAQSHLRQDLLPSFWSQAGIVIRPGRIVTVPLEGIGEASKVTRDNGVVELPLKLFDDPVRWPNVAVLQFGAGVTRRDVDAVRHDRSIADLPGLMLKWLGFVWGAEVSANPLLGGHGIPSATFVEAAYSLERIDLTPGLATGSSCPEAIWQSAKWWREFYEKTTAGTADLVGAGATVVPRGKYLLRQPAAAVAVE
jgi:hypothetical protein